jgi:hypothetical protein
VMAETLLHLDGKALVESIGGGGIDVVLQD